MKKKQKKLSLEKLNIARLTRNMYSIYGGGRTEPTNTCNDTTTTSDNCTTLPQSNSSLECGLISGNCDTYAGPGN